MAEQIIEPVDLSRLEPWLQGRSFESWYAQYNEEGYALFENVMPPAEVDQVRAILEPHLVNIGRNDFEGFKSNRVYGLLAKSPEVFSDMVTHPLLLAFAEAELGQTCLLGSLLAVNLLPGETAQDWHHDDGYIQVPLPHPAYGVSIFWNLTDTTETNGATEVIPGSHLWSKEDVHKNITDAGKTLTGLSGSVKAAMPAGSLMIAKGSLWHRGGANQSEEPRLIITPQYCPGWARQLENMMAAVPRKVAASLPKRTRQLMGYSIHGVFMGFVDGVHPDKLLSITA